MPKLTTTPITGSYASVAKLNANFQAIEDALENTLSRDGTSPNEILADIDFNSNRILNLPAPINSTEPVRLADLPAGVGGTAALTTIVDADEVYTSDNVEGALQEVGAVIFGVKSYGARGDGVTDDTAAIQAAIDAASAAGGGEVFIPRGTYRLTSTLTINASAVTLQGEGIEATILTRSTDYGNTILVTSGAAEATEAVLTATIVGGEITAINIVSGGSGYQTAPKVIIGSGTGFGATATATITGGVVTAVTVTNGGSGYVAANVRVNGTTALNLGNGVSGMTIQATGLMSSGAHIHMRGIAYVNCSNLYIWNGFVGVRLSGVGKGKFDDVNVRVTNTYGAPNITGRIGVLMDSAGGNYSHPSCGGMQWVNFNIESAAYSEASPAPDIEYGLYVTCMDGLWMSNGRMGGANIADICFAADDPYDSLSIVLMSNVMCDKGFPSSTYVPSVPSDGTVGILFKQSINEIKNLKFTSMDIRGGNVGTNGIKIEEGTDVYGVEFVGCTVRGWGEEGVKLLSGNELLFDGCVVRANSRESDDGFSGYYLEDVVHSRLLSGSSGAGIDDRDSEDYITQKYGIEFGDGCSEILINGMDLTSNALGSISGGTDAYVLSACILDKTPAAHEPYNLVNYGGFNFDGSTDYLDTNALTGIADGKKGTFVAKVRFSNAATGTENLLSSTGARISVLRNSSGQIRVSGLDAALATIFSQSTNAVLASAGTYTIMASWETNLPSFTVTINNSSPDACVVTATGHGLRDGQAIYFSTSGTLPSPLVAGTMYYVGVIDANTFNIYPFQTYVFNDNLPAIITTTAGSGTHTAQPVGFQYYINDAPSLSSISYAAYSSTPGANEIDYTTTEYALGANASGTSKLVGDLYAVWFSATEAIDFTDVANRRKFFDASGNMKFLGARGELPTGTIPILFHAYDDFTEWPLNRGSATSTWTVSGTPNAAATATYGQDEDLGRTITVTAATHTVGRTVDNVICNFAGTVTLTLPSATSYPGREIWVRTVTANAVNSASSNVAPITDVTPGTAILAATDGKAALLKSDGLNWQIVMAN